MSSKRNKPRVKRSYTIESGIISTLCVLIIAATQFFFMDDIFLSAKKTSMKFIADEISQMDFSTEESIAILSDLEANHDVYIEIYSPRDKLIYTTDGNQIVYEHKENDSTSDDTVLKPKIMKFISRTDEEDGSYFELRQEYYTTAQYIVYGTFFSENSGIEIYSSADVLKENATTASWVLFALSVVISMLISIIAEIYINIFTKPLMIINEKTKKITQMDFSETCPSFKVKDLDELSTNINTLSASLNSALNKLKDENLKLEEDIEAERRLEKILRTFIANASHELKTPISIIQAYAEGMKYGIGCDSTEQFCDIIIDETHKMNDLVVRLMEYLHYGSGNYKLNQSTFNISELICENLKLQSNKLESKGAILKADIDESFFGYGDTEMILTVFNNYLSNALSHLDYEKEIIVKAEDKGDRYTVSVYNSGKPIPGTDIENIWQSFYRSDKSHSRAEGRFGLGLSIVSTIQKLHEQKYGVINFEKGVEFWFDIKKGTPKVLKA